MHSQWAHFLQDIHFTHSSPGAEFLNESPHTKQSTSTLSLDAAFARFCRRFPLGPVFFTIFTSAWAASFCGVEVSMALFIFRRLLVLFGFLGPAFGNGRTCSGVVIAFTPEREYGNARLHPNSRSVHPVDHVMYTFSLDVCSHNLLWTDIGNCTCFMCLK